tara:strand:- start:34472 stop:35623 length:1152 start_codon:yes stop_codon:yes gene_type:complete
MWLLEASVRQAMEQAKQSGFMATVEQQIEYEARSISAAGGGSRIMTVAGSTAEIAVKGVITKSPDIMAMLFGGGNTTYSDITTALAEASSNPAIKDITMAIDSPGGTVDGLFDTLAAIEATPKPVKAVVSNTAASAAYAIAAQADEIVATNKAARFGSVGIVATMGVDDSVVRITSTEAPKKAPDVSTDEGKAVVREELDALHEIFVDAIASGRGTTTDKINADFGQGATLLASEALKRGMIDSLMSADSTTTATSGNKQEAINMDLNTLKAQHSDVYAAAVQEGVAQERDRVGAHLIMGQQAGAIETAIEACKDGSEMTSTLQATYMTAGMNRADVKAREEDDKGATAGNEIDADNQELAKEAAGSAILNLAASNCGVELGA